MNDEQRQFIRDNWDNMTADPLRKLVNEKFGESYKPTAFSYHTKKMGLTKFASMHRYTKDEDEILKINAPKMSRERLTVLFNEKFKTSINIGSIATRCCQKGYEAHSDGQFHKGSVPWEKSKGGREAYIKNLKPNSASFEKGHVPHNSRSVGSTRIQDNNVYIKTENGWVSEKRLNWESVNGKVPEGMKLITVDENPLNADISNLRLVDNDTMVVLMSNDWLNKGTGIVDTGIQYAKLYNLMKQK